MKPSARNAATVKMIQSLFENVVTPDVVPHRQNLDAPESKDVPQFLQMAITLIGLPDFILKDACQAR